MSEITRTLYLESGGQTIEMNRYSLTRLDDGASLMFEDRRIAIGSSPENDYVIHHPSVSRVHAEIVAENGAFRIRDLNSKNGTYVSGIRIESVYLHDHIILQFGLVEVEFSLTSDKVSVHISGKERFGDLLGSSIAMREVFGILERVAPTDATVLIEGESGTGKELAAEAIHMHSERRNEPFIVVDCSSIDRELIASELFGHVKGAFTGAISNRQGAFEAAAGGTLFLDELGELPLDLQPKLLRALEKREIKPLGTNTTIKTNVRIIAATNRHLLQEVKEGSFREDLYYRFAVIRVRLPPLRERLDDIPLLIQAILKRKHELSGEKQIEELNYSTVRKFQLYHWPGNVRELRNAVERATVLANGTQIDTNFIGLDIPSTPEGENANQGSSNILIEATRAAENSLSFKDAKENLLYNFERVYWTTLLARANGNVSEVGRIANVHRKTVEYNLKKLGIMREDFLDRS